MTYPILKHCANIIAFVLLLLGKSYGQAGLSAKEITTADAAGKLLQPIGGSWEASLINLHTWKNAGVNAIDIGFGANGSMWRVDVSGAIFRFLNDKWQRVPGVAARIAVDPSGAAWVVNKVGEIYKFNLATNAWNIMPGNAMDISIGADGSVWVVGKQGEIFKLVNNSWTKFPGVATQIAVDNKGLAWIVNPAREIYQYNGSGFIKVWGQAQDIGIGNNAVYIVGNDGYAYAWSNGWGRLTGLAGIPLQSIAVDKTGLPWGITKEGTLYQPQPPVIDDSAPGVYETKSVLLIGDEPELPSKDITITQSGGYVASVKLTYILNGNLVTSIDQNGLPAGWRKAFTIPGYATQIKLLIKAATGVVWDPWRTVVDQTWEKPTEVCVKVFGTTLAPSSNNGCN